MSQDPRLEAVAEAIWNVDAPRYGNDVLPFADVRDGRRIIALERAKAAIRCLDEIAEAGKGAR